MLCIHCGREIGDGDTFCPGCGKKQVVTYQEVFVRNGLSEKDFIDNINKWFQYHPQAANVTCTFGLDTSIGLLANKYVMNQFVIRYELLQGTNANQYGLVKEEKFGFAKTDTAAFVGDWQNARPGVKVVNWKGGTHSRGYTASHLMGGLGACNQLNAYILFKFPRTPQV